ncbi:antibiotic resistance protein VanZ, partial [Candidatus Poribacteria bacterium]
AVFGATDELHQYFVPGREASPFDWMADVGGGIIAAAGVRIVKGRKGEVKG